MLPLLEKVSKTVLSCLRFPDHVVNTPSGKIYEQYGAILFFGTIFVVLLFITVSFLFFRGIRKRLLGLQDAMVIRDVDSLPIQIDTNRKDEIGQLEADL